MTRPASLHIKSTGKERSDARQQHQREIIGHTLDNAAAVGHGMAVGHQGGHKMPSDSNFQKGAYINRGALQNRQNTSSDGAGSANANGPGADDYGKVDNPND